MNQCRNGGSDLPPFFKTNIMNLEITYKQQSFIIEGLKARIQSIEKLIPNFTSMELVASYINDLNEIKQLLNQIESL